MDRNIDRRKMIQGTAAAAMLNPALTNCVSASEMLPIGLDALAQQKGLRFGSAFKINEMRKPKLAELYKHECGIVVPALAFKWRQIENRKEKYVFEPADKSVAFAENNSLKIRGHTLCWNVDKNLPQWLREAEANMKNHKASKIGKILTTHIDRMVARYPTVKSWDVVNEVIKVSTGKPRDSLLVRNMGIDFVDLCFNYAREKMPDAELVYNDFMRWDYKNSKHRSGVLKLLEGLLKRGVPVDALGIQSHLGPSVGKVDERAWIKFLDEIKGMGLKVLLTELDCSDLLVPTKNIAERDAITATEIKRYLDLTLSYENVTEVITWGLSDKDAYVNKPHNLARRRREDGLPQRVFPYDEYFRPKPMRNAIAEAIIHAPVR